MIIFFPKKTLTGFTGETKTSQYTITKTLLALFMFPPTPPPQKKNFLGTSDVKNKNVYYTKFCPLPQQA